MIHPLAYQLILAFMTMISGAALILAYRKELENKKLREEVEIAEAMKKRIEVFLKGLGYRGLRTNGRIDHSG